MNNHGQKLSTKTLSTSNHYKNKNKTMYVPSAYQTT